MFKGVKENGINHFLKRKWDISNKNSFKSVLRTYLFCLV